MIKDMSTSSIYLELIRLADMANDLRAELDRRHTGQKFYDCTEAMSGSYVFTCDFFSDEPVENNVTYVDFKND